MNNAPKVRRRGVDDAELPPTFGRMMLRVFTPLMWLTNPVLLGLTKVSVWPAVKQRKVRPGLLIAACAAVLAIVVFFARALPLYVQPYVDLVTAAIAGTTGKGIAGIGSSVAEVASAKWILWILGQLVFAVPAAALIGAWIGAHRKKWDPAQWREKEQHKDLASLRKANEAMPRWTQQAPATVEPDAGKPADRLSRAVLSPFKAKPDVVTNFSELKIRLGSESVAGKPYDLPAVALARQSYIEGPSGFGKTRVLIELMRGLVEAPAAQQFKIGMAFINMKPDPSITSAARAIAKLAGRRLIIVTEDGRDDGEGMTYNPLRHGTAEQIRNRVIEAERNAADGGFSEAHYARGGSRFALYAAKALIQLAEPADGRPRTYTRSGKQHAWKRDYPHYAYLMSTRTLSDNLQHLDVDLQWQIKEWIEESKHDKDMQKFPSGMRERLGDVAEGAAGRVIAEHPAGLDLREVIRNGDMVLFNLDAMQDAQAARYVANLALQDLTAAIGEFGDASWHKPNRDPDAEGQNRMFWIPTDEFSALGGTLLADLYARSRSNGFAVTLATQDQSALIKAEMFEDINTNANVKILFNQERNAEDHANNVGTAKKMIETFQLFEERDMLGSTARASGQGNIREGDAYIIHPNDFKNLQPGEAVILIKTPRQHDKVALRMSNPAKEAAALPAAPAAKPAPVPAPAAAPAVPLPAADPWAAAAAQAQAPAEPVAPAPRPAPKAERATKPLPAAEDWAEDDWADYTPAEEPEQLR